MSEDNENKDEEPTFETQIIHDEVELSDEESDGDDE